VYVSSVAESIKSTSASIEPTFEVRHLGHLLIILLCLIDNHSHHLELFYFSFYGEILLVERGILLVLYEAARL
jgi:hypothetical protein